jgi:ATP-dependent Clp protease ATP-binding subunit ClpC
MEVTLPVFVYSEPVYGQREHSFNAQLLFQPKVRGQDTSLQRAIQKLTRRARVEVDQLGRHWDHTSFAQLLLNPDTQTQRLKLDLDLKSRRVRFNVFLVIFQMGNRLVAFSPQLRQVWFQLDTISRLQERATEVYAKFFRQQLQQTDQPKISVESVSLTGQAWVSTIDIDVTINQKSPAESVKDLLALWDEEKLDGAVELQKTGRCLDWMYPEDLQRALGREDEANELERLLDLPDNRSVLIVGPHLVGKTNLIHEAVFRRTEKRQRKHRNSKNVWLLSPQRLISGMIYVGQWENRLLAILAEARRRRHTLYFDDLLGLFHSGKSRDSDLCVADLLRNAIQSRSIPVIAEITPDALEILNQLDRSFVDLFHIQRLDPLPLDQMFNLLVDVKTQCEVQHRCWFDLDVLPKIIDLTQRYQRTAAFPGKAVRVLKQLSVRQSRHHIGVDDLYTTFKNSTGLSLKLVQDSRRIRREEILDKLHARIVGQDEAIESCSDIVAVAKARLNDPNRPLATMLFLGPTGVGKTETAKALTEFLFDSPDAMIRFDLNQYKSSYSAAILVGTALRPEGLLTQSVSQRPFCVLLLDEVEKAHPDVLEVLLQVLGEGRLTDARGRTTDFSNCIIIMTSNLGTGTASRQIGYTANESRQSYVNAARKFFRPEFFNRIDRIIPFHPLSLEQIRQIADGLMRDVIAREGLARRSCVLQVEPAALQEIADEGFHPELGARAMRRAIEQQFVAPVSRRLAEIVSDSPTVISASAGRDQLRVNVQPLENQQPVSHWNIDPDPQQLSAAAEAFINRVKQSSLSHRPQGEISASGISPELLHYYAVDEQLNQFVARFKEFEADLKSKSVLDSVPQIKSAFRNTRSAPQGVRSLLAADDVETYLSEVSYRDDKNEKRTVELARQLQSEAALLDLMISGDANEHCWFVIKMDGRIASRPSGMLFNRLTDAYMVMFKDTLGFDVQLQTIDTDEKGGMINVLSIAGPAAIEIASREAMPSLYFDAAGRLYLLQIAILPQSWVDQNGIESAVNRAYAARFEPKKDEAVVSNEALSNGESSDSENPFKIVPMSRVYHATGKTIDFRTQTTLDQWPDATQLYQLMIGGLERPAEFK